MTPRPVLDALGPFDLDPATPAVQPWPTAARRYTIEDDGLHQSWQGRVWLNPPYSDIEAWMAKLAAHGQGTALVFARCETAWWFESVWNKCSGILFLRGRLYFCHPDGTPAGANSGGPSALIAYGSNDLARLEHSGLPGALVKSPKVVGPGRPVPAPAGERRSGFSPGPRQAETVRLF
jgi:hypothetical protein